MTRACHARILASAALISAAVVTAAQGPPSPAVPQRPTGLILGTVVDADTGRGVRNAVVSIRSVATPGVSVGTITTPDGTRITAAAPAVSRQILTGSRGEFLFRDLSKGSYIINVQAPGYLAGGSGERRPTGAVQPITLDDGQKVGDAEIRLWRAAGLSGTVLDEAGEPMVGVGVTVAQRVLIRGRWMFSAVSATTRTDDRGMYRISGLQPASFLVLVPTSFSAVPLSVVDAVEQVMISTGAQNPTSSEVYRSLLSSRAPNTLGTGAQVGEQILLSMSPLGGPPTAAAVDAGGRISGYQTTFYPNVAAPGLAAAIALKSGEERSGVDLQLRSVAMTRVSGALTGPDGPQGNFGVRLTLATPPDSGILLGSSMLDVATTATDAAGAFMFPAVPSGQYTLKALQLPRAPITPASDAMIISGANGGGVSISSMEVTRPPAVLPDGPTLWAELPLTVGDKDIGGLAVQVRKGSALSGQIKFEGAAAPPASDRLQAIAVSARSVDADDLSVGAGSFVSIVTPAGEFKTQQYPPGKYFVSASGLPGWFYASATLGGVDVATAPLVLSGSDVAGLVITYVDRRATLTVSVTDKDGKADGAAGVVAFPFDHATWIANGMSNLLEGSGRTSSAGVSAFSNVLPGDYLVAAVDEDTLADWMEPKMIEALARIATRVTIGPGENKTLTVTTKAVQRP